MTIVGITGGIGSGKSTVCKVFETLGMPVFNSDDEAKSVYTDFPEVLEAVRSQFGDIVFSGVELNKAALASIVFENEEALRKLNQLIHPLVRSKFDKWVEKQNSPYVLREAAILIESGAAADCDFVILVKAPESVRIERVLLRNGLSEVQIKQRMTAQMSDDEKSPKSDFIINNDGSELVLHQILKIHQSLLQSSGTELL